MGKISSLLCRELHAQALLTTVIVHIISCALLWKFTLQTLAPCQVTQQPFIIFWAWKPELWNCRMEEVAFAPLPFLTLFPVSVNQREALRTSDEGGVHLQGCRVSCLVMAPCSWSGVCRTPVGPCWGQQMSACRQTSLDLGFTSGDLAEAWRG